MVTIRSKTLLLITLSTFSTLTLAMGNNAKQPNPSYTIAVTKIATQYSEVKGLDSELKHDTWMFDANATFRLNRQWSLAASIGYDSVNYDWSSASKTLQTAPWSTVKRIRASMNLTYFYDRNWIYTLTPQVKTAYADELSSSDAYSYGAVTTGMYRFDDNNLLGFGVAYLNDLNEVRTFPFIAVNWNFNDKWSISNPFKSNFSGPAGLELRYKLNEKVSLGLGATIKRERFLVSANDVTAELQETLSFIKLQYKATPAFTALIHLGYYTNGQLEFSHNLGTFDRENQVAAAINLQYQF